MQIRQPRNFVIAATRRVDFVSGGSFEGDEILPSVPSRFGAT
jgi:hypothetical protein